MVSTDRVKGDLRRGFVDRIRDYAPVLERAVRQIGPILPLRFGIFEAFLKRALAVRGE